MLSDMRSIPALCLLISPALPLLAEEPLPSPWKHQDIGVAELLGAAAHVAGVFAVQGTMDIWGPADGCHLVWQPLHGDAELVVRVTGMENPGGVDHAKASLSIRESLDAGSRSVTPTDGTQFLYREHKDGITTRVSRDADALKAGVPKGQFPCWLKIVRRGNDFSGYESADGESWRLSGRIHLDLAEDTVAGLAASSHRKDILIKAVFDHVKFGK